MKRHRSIVWKPAFTCANAQEGGLPSVHRRYLFDKVGKDVTIQCNLRQCEPIRSSLNEKYFTTLAEMLATPQVTLISDPKGSQHKIAVLHDLLKQRKFYYFFSDRSEHKNKKESYFNLFFFCVPIIHQSHTFCLFHWLKNRHAYLEEEKLFSKDVVERAFRSPASCSVTSFCHLYRRL